MSYLVLARKYRPMFFDDVVGQQHVTRTLQNAIEQNRLANAYLFSGPRGVGKTTVARILSKALNCENGPTINPCNTCSFCQEINESRSLDVFEIDGASNRGIDEVRNLRESLRYSPNPGKHRIYIIDEVHMLTNEAFNALLKTLEEPPKNVLFVFATTEAHKLPATILSRCQRFDFKRITNKGLIEQLKNLCKQEDIEIEDEALRHIANKGDGSMRDSQSILDQIIAYAGKTITGADVENLLGIINQELFFQVSDLILQGDVEGGVQLAAKIFIEGYDFSEFLMGLSEHLRNILVAKATQSTDELDVSEEYAQRYLAVVDAFEVEDLLRLVKIASETETLIRRSSNARLHLEVALVKMIKLSKSVTVNQLFQRLDDVKKKADFVKKTDIAQPQAQAKPAPARKFSIDLIKKPDTTQVQSESKTDDTEAPEADTTLTLEDIEAVWEKVLNQVRDQRINVGSCLTEGWPTRVNGPVLEISFNPQNGFQMSTVERNKSIIQEAIQNHTGQSLRINCVPDKKGVLEEVRKIAPPPDKKEEFEKLVKENKSMQNIVDTFDAEFVE